MELSRTIESCWAGCLFFTSYNEYMHLTVKLGTVPINFVQSMRLNIDVVEKIRKVEQDRRTHLYGPTLKCLGLPYDPMFKPTLSNCDCCWLSNSSPPATRSAYPLSTLTLDLFCSEKTRREDYSIECKALMLHNSPSLYRVSAFVLSIFLESGLI